MNVIRDVRYHTLTPYISGESTKSWALGEEAENMPVGKYTDLVQIISTTARGEEAGKYCAHMITRFRIATSSDEGTTLGLVSYHSFYEIDVGNENLSQKRQKS